MWRLKTATKSIRIHIVINAGASNISIVASTATTFFTATNDIHFFRIENAIFFCIGLILLINRAFVLNLTNNILKANTQYQIQHVLSL